MSNFAKENIAYTVNSEVREIANKLVREIITTLKDSTKSELFEGTTAYIDNPELIFSMKNFKSDRIKCGHYDGKTEVKEGNIRIQDIYMVSMYNSLEVVELDKNILLLYSPEIPFCKRVPPTITFTSRDDDAEDIDVFGEVLIVGFDWTTNSFRSLTEKDFEEIKSLIS